MSHQLMGCTVPQDFSGRKRTCVAHLQDVCSSVAGEGPSNVSQCKSPSGLQLAWPRHIASTEA